MARRQESVWIFKAAGQCKFNSRALIVHALALRLLASAQQILNNGLVIFAWASDSLVVLSANRRTGDNATTTTSAAKSVKRADHLSYAAKFVHWTTGGSVFHLSDQ
jgi:hypothetical protein